VGRTLVGGGSISVLVSVNLDTVLEPGGETLTGGAGTLLEGVSVLKGDAVALAGGATASIVVDAATSVVFGTAVVVGAAGGDSGLEGRCRVVPGLKDSLETVTKVLGF
jgi:hypothetical protein